MCHFLAERRGRSPSVRREQALELVGGTIDEPVELGARNGVELSGRERSPQVSLRCNASGRSLDG
jgi:hypothetical protein